MTLNDAEMRELEESRAASGVPVTVEDPLVLARVAGIIARATEDDEDIAA